MTLTAIDAAAAAAVPVSSRLTWRDRRVHVAARLGYRRSEHRVPPGLFALGQPTPESPVFVTANYALSFDALRSALPGQDAYLLVLDTAGINVWCAAGKGTFGTGELVRRIGAVGLADVVSHRRLILPQLGAPGVAAHEVRRRTGFRVEYGPVRAADLPEYLRTGRATPAMRQVRFGLADRLVLIPVDVVHVALPALLAAVIAYLLGGLPAAVGVLAAALAGTALVPALLPWVPSADLSSKGFIAGGLTAALFAGWELAAGGGAGLAAWLRSAGLLLALPSITAYLALNFTGATPFTSRSGVKAEIATYIPVMAALAALGLVALLAGAVISLAGG